MQNFKHIRSTQKDVNNKTIYSGQLVSVHGRINKRETVEVYFNPDYGFRIQGNNFADAYDIKIEKDINIIQKILGAIGFACFNVFGSINMSWLEFVNITFFQWFFVRLTRCQETKVVSFSLKEVSVLSDGSMGMAGKPGVQIYSWFSIQLWILPLTGWKGKFKYLNKIPKFIRITDKTNN